MLTSLSAARRPATAQPPLPAPTTATSHAILRVTPPSIACKACLTSAVSRAFRRSGSSAKGSSPRSADGVEQVVAGVLAAPALLRAVAAVVVVPAVLLALL